MPTASIVNQCTATECAYNDDRQCRALAITVGEPTAATCGTYTPHQAKGGYQMTVANVGACKASNCVHNSDLTCQASAVTVGMANGSVGCLTFQAGK